MEGAPSPCLPSYSEFSPLDHLISRVPHLGRLGGRQDLTSLTGSREFLALGTSSGSVYWYSRREDSLQRMDCWSDTAVTCLALVETTDLMLAVGSGAGDLTIFQIPKPVLTNIGVPFPGTIQDIQEFSIRKVHTTGTSISALCWATNGERLFSGDTGGRLVMSVVDFFKNTVQTSVLSVEPGEVRALSYLHRTLLVSSAGETAVVELGLTGLAERRVKVAAGETERPLASSLLQAGVGRPGLRCLLVMPGNSVMVTNTAGTLHSSLPVSQLLARPQPEIPVINPVSIAREEDGQCENIRVLSAQDQTVLLWSKTCLHLVSLVTGSVVASCRSLRNILDLAVTSSGEMFVLETRRSVVRLGRTEDSLTPCKTDWRRGSTVAQAADTELESALQSAAANIPRFPLLNSLAGSLSSELRSLKQKLKAGGSQERAEQGVEAILGLDNCKSTQSSAEVRNLLDPEFKTRMDRIGEVEFTAEIVQQRSPRRYKKVRSIREKTGDCEETQNTSDNSDDSGDIEVETPTTTTTTNSSDRAGGSEGGLSTEEKELALMKMLRIQQEEDEDEKKDEEEAEDGENGEDDEELREQPVEVAETEVDANNTETSLASLGYGPPSDSIEHRSLQSLGREEVPHQASGEKEGEEEREEESQACIEREGEMESEARAETEGWLHYSVPGRVVSLAETLQYLVLCDIRDHVYYSSLATPGSSLSLSWRRAPYQASQLATSRSGSLVWRLLQHTAFCLLQPRQDRPVGSGWLEICRNVASLTMTENSGWIVKQDGGLVVHQDLSPSAPSSSRPRQIYTGHFITEVRQWDNFLLAMTDNASLLLARLELLAEETAWQPLLVCADPQLRVAGFDVSPAGELWVVGRTGEEREEREETTQLLLSSDWSTGLTVSWSELSSPHCLLSPPPSRPPVLLPASRLWAASTSSPSLLAHPHPVTTYLWARLEVSAQLSSLRLERLHAGGREAYSGHLLLQLARGGRQSGRQSGPALLQLELGRKSLLTAVAPLPAGEQLSQVSVVPGQLWVLAESGSVFVLQSRQAGQWRRLDTSQLAGQSRLVSLSLSQAGQAWAVDESGQVFLGLQLSLQPVWLALEREEQEEQEEVRLVEVVCSSGGSMVWARDSRQGVWARVGLYPDCLPQGTGWVAVTGLAVTRLAVSPTSVWALAVTGRVYRRTGLSSTNWVGDSWQAVPGLASARDLTVGQCDTVWSLGQGGDLGQLEIRQTSGPHTAGTTTEETDWTIIQ